MNTGTAAESIDVITITVGIIFPTALMLLLLTGTVANYVKTRRWYNLIQVLGVAAVLLPNTARFLFPRHAGAYNSILSRSLGIIGMAGAIVFVLGYLAMAIKKRKR